MRIWPTWRELKVTLIVLLLASLTVLNIVTYRMAQTFRGKLDEIYQLAELQGGWVYFVDNVAQDSGE